MVIQNPFDILDADVNGDAMSLKLWENQRMECVEEVVVKMQAIVIVAEGIGMLTILTKMVIMIMISSN